MRVKHYSLHTERAYISWIKKYIFFHKIKHPKDMGVQEVEAFLTHLAVDRTVAASTQNQAFNALLFLYQKVVDIQLGEIDSIRAKHPETLPVVLTKDEALLVISYMEGIYKMIGNILFGSGLRIKECLRLRIQDIDFKTNQIIVRNGKGQKDRVTMLPESIQPYPFTPSPVLDRKLNTQMHTDGIEPQMHTDEHK